MNSLRTLRKFNLTFLFLFLPTLYVVLISRFGFEDSDSGFIVGLGWRILNGELPYQDFIYIRPPLSPYLSSFYLAILPEFGQVFLLRLINSYQLFIQVLLTILILKKHYDFKQLHINFFAFVVICFFVTASGTLYFQWHTTDGIFLGVLGLFLIEYFNKSKLISIAAGFCLATAFLAKQNFLLIPILGVFYTYFHYGWKKMIFVLLGIMIGLFSFFKFLLDHNIYHEFISQTTGATAIKDILIAGFGYYLIKHEFLFLYIISILFSILLLFTFFKYFSSIKKYRKIRDSAFLILSLFFLFVYNSSYVIISESREKLISFDRILPVLGVLYFLYLIVKGKENFSRHMALLTLIGFSWATSISWGGMTPIMFFTPIIFLVYYLLVTNTRCLDSPLRNIVMLILIILISISNNLVSYRSGFIWNNKKDGGEISPKLSFIKMTDLSFEKHEEFQNLLSLYPNSTVLPSMPGAYYLHNSTNKMVIDWPMDVEANYDREKLIKSIHGDCNFVFVEKKSFGQPIGVKGRFYSSISDYVQENFQIVDNNFEFFTVYTKR